VSCIRDCITISNCGRFDDDRQVLLDAIKKKTYDDELRREDLLMTIRRHHVHGVILFSFFIGSSRYSKFLICVFQILEFPRIPTLHLQSYRS